MSKQYVVYEIEGEKVYVEAESTGSDVDEEISNGSDEPIDGGKFEKAIQGIKPVAKSVLGMLKDLSDPSEVEIEMGVKLGAKAGVILASVDSEATMVIKLKWQRKAQNVGKSE
ncbi:CU044_2847 family protein [Leucothrix mucor]|uniref:CU044_2847 family protein n=1 Tax=Leucothrix mucor TaxID=45248 RepID=UPI0003B414D7|nr:CU044_2847 family protein [Leucothrix mucor]